MFTSRRITTMSGDKFKDDFSLNFDGTNDYINTSFRPNYIHTNATMGMWAKNNDYTGDFLFGSHGQAGKRWYMGIHQVSGTNYGKIGVQSSFKSNIVLSPQPVEGQWIHVVVTAIDGTATFYLDGVAQDTGNLLSYTQDSDKNPDEDWLIGAVDITTIDDFFEGAVSEVFHYDKGLTASEVKTLYNGREPYNHKEGVCSNNLKAWWRMGDGLENNSGTTIYDMSDNTNNGTMTNMESNDFVGDTP